MESKEAPPLTLPSACAELFFKPDQQIIHVPRGPETVIISNKALQIYSREFQRIIHVYCHHDRLVHTKPYTASTTINTQDGTIILHDLFSVYFFIYICVRIIPLTNHTLPP